MAAGSKAAAPIAKDVMTFFYDRDQAMASLTRLEEGWNRERLAAELVPDPALSPAAINQPEDGGGDTSPARPA